MISTRSLLHQSRSMSSRPPNTSVVIVAYSINIVIVIFNIDVVMIIHTSTCRQGNQHQRRKGTNNGMQFATLLCNYAHACSCSGYNIAQLHTNVPVESRVHDISCVLVEKKLFKDTVKLSHKRGGKYPSIYHVRKILQKF